MEGYQFAHVEPYSAKGKASLGPDEQHGKRKNGQRAWTAQEIIDELERLQHASQHVISGRPGPEILPGDVSAFADLRSAQIRAAVVKESFPYTTKDGSKAIRQRKLRADAPSIYASVVSVPVRTEDALADSEIKAAAMAALDDAVEHERDRLTKAGGRFMMAVRHWDEEFLHVHIIALDPIRGRVKHLHPGHAAKDQVHRENMGRGLAKKEINRLGNRAYCNAMRGWQDDFYDAVFRKHGLLRYGPRRERLSTSAYARAKESARLRASDEAWRADIERDAAEAERKKRLAEDEINRSKTMKTTVAKRADAFDFGTGAVLAEQIVYRPKRSDKEEGLSFGPKAPTGKAEREGISARIQPAFDLILGFARRFAQLGEREEKIAQLEAEKETLDAERREHEKQIHAYDLMEARQGWRARVLAKTTRSLRGLVPKPLEFIVDALVRGDDPVMEKGPEAFPEAWSIPEKPDRRKVQEKLDGISNGVLAQCFSATQDAYLLCDDEPKLQKTFATGIKMLVHEATLRGLDIESGKHDPSTAKCAERAQLHRDTPPEPIRVKRSIRERQLVR